MRYRLLFGLLLILNTIAQSQNVGISADNSSPDPSALLHLKSNDKGILIPRMNANQRMNIQNPAQGLMVFDGSEDRFYFFNNGNWEFLADQNFAIQDLIAVGDSLSLTKSNASIDLNSINHWAKRSDTLQSVNNIVRIKNENNSPALLFDDDKASLNNSSNLIETDRQWMNLLIDANDDQENAHFAIYNNAGLDTNTAQLFLHFDGDDSWINTTELGIGTPNPTQRLDVNGGLRIRDADTTNLRPGTMRYNDDKNDFEGWNGTKWLSLTYGNPGSDVVYNQSTSHPMSEATQYTSTDIADTNLGGQLCQIGDYVFIRFNAGAGNGYKIRVLKNDGGQWGIDTTLTYQGSLAGNDFGQLLKSDSSRLVVSNAFNGSGDVSIYTVDSNGINLEQIITTKPFNGLDIHEDQLVVSGDDSTYIFKRGPNNLWTQKSFLYYDGPLEIWDDRMVRFNSSTAVDDDLEIWHKVGNVWGMVYSDSLDCCFNAMDMYGQFFAVVRQNDIKVLNYENGTYQEMTLPSDISDHEWESVELFGDYLMVGAFRYSFQGGFGYDGIARIYKFNGTEWETLTDITDPFPDTSIGFKVSTDGVNYVIGAPNASVNGVFSAGKVLLGPVE